LQQDVENLKKNSKKNKQVRSKTTPCQKLFLTAEILGNIFLSFLSWPKQTTGNSNQRVKYYTE